MKRKNIYCIFPFLAIGLCLLLAISCTKDDNNNSDKTVKDIDGNVYHTVTIGTQTWMVENLKTTKYRNGDPIPNVTDDSEWGKLSTGAYCDFENISGDGATYGKLYNWYAVDDIRNIAPTGWHVPTDEEWTILRNYLIDNGYNWDGSKDENKVAKALASKTNWANSTEEGAIGNDLTKNNSTGFTALPGGCRSYFGPFYDIVKNGNWWSSTALSTFNAYYRKLTYDSSFLYNLSYYGKGNGYSVRCLRDY